MLLYQDIADRIIEFSTADLNSLASLCRVSRACVPTARKHLYRVLELRTESRLSGGFRIGETYVDQHLRLQRAEAKKREAILNNDHLRKYVKSLTIAIVASFHSDGASILGNALSMLPWISFAVQNRANFEHIHLQLIRGTFNPTSGSVGPQVRQILASPSLKSVTLDIIGSGSIASDVTPFSEWILRSISSSVTKLDMIAAGNWYREPSSWGSGISARRPTREGPREPRFLEDISLTMIDSLPSANKIVNWAARLGEPSVNFDLSRANKLKIRSHVTDSSPWSLAEQASKTLEELTIDRLPYDETFPPPDRFAQYRALRSLSLTLVHEPEERFPINRLCWSLALIFTHPLPSTLHHISINLDLGCCSDTDWEYTFPQIFDDKDFDVECWDKLDRELAGQPSVRTVTICLVWGNRRAQTRGLVPTPPFVLPRAKAIKMQEVWTEKLQVFLARWRELFGRVAQKGMLDKVQYTWTPEYLNDV